MFILNTHLFLTGSYGTYPLPVRNAIRGYQKLAEAAPDKFMRYQSADLLKNSRVGIARMLNVPADECVFVQNATLGKPYLNTSSLL
jgi:hercynylcysteine S-oxide lyase